MGHIADFLVAEGLAKRIDSAWYEVDSALGNQFMAYLAAVLGALRDVNATPITDRAEYAVALGYEPAVVGRKKSLHRFKARQVILNSILPVPSDPIDVGDLVNFKARYGHLLPQFRAKIEAHCATIALLPEPADRIAATRAFIDDCHDQVAEIEAAMRPSFGRVTFRSLVPLFGAGLTVCATDQGNILSYAGAGFSLVAAAYGAISSIRDPRMALQARPLAYMAHARTFAASGKGK